MKKTKGTKNDAMHFVFCTDWPNVANLIRAKKTNENNQMIQEREADEERGKNSVFYRL